MIAKRLLTTIFAIVLTVSCVHSGRAEEVTQKQIEPGGGHVTAAVVSNFFYVPGKLGACVASGGLWTAVMIVTGGAFYKEMADLVHSACAEKWVIRGKDMAN